MLIDWNTVLKHCPNITGIIHVGAYTGEEAKVYKNIPTIWVEADPDLVKVCQDKGLNCLHFAATNYTGTAKLNRMPFRPANSLLEPNLNRRRSDVYVEEVIEVPARKLMNIQEPLFNMLVMDIQGAELMALEGTYLRWISYIYTEVHILPTYVNVPMMEEIDDYLEDYTRVETKMLKRGWGDALYTYNIQR